MQLSQLMKLLFKNGISAGRGHFAGEGGCSSFMRAKDKIAVIGNILCFNKVLTHISQAIAVAGVNSANGL